MADGLDYLSPMAVSLGDLTAEPVDAKPLTWTRPQARWTAAVQPLREGDAYPAMPEDGYGWEKLFSERMCRHFREDYGVPTRIARYHNVYGPHGTWTGGREKAPAAICRKVAHAENGGVVEVWGDGTAVRSYIYVDDLLDGIVRLMQSNITVPANIGSTEYVSVRELVETVIEISGKQLTIKYVAGPVGVQSRNFSNARIYSVGWRPKTSLRDGLATTYEWVKQQVTMAGRQL